jgi:hypothetical protein
VSLRDKYLQKTSYCIKDSQRADVVVLWLKRLLAEAQAETVERLANWLYAELKARTWHDKDDATAEVVAQKLRALSPDPHARERWELEAKIRELHDWPELCNGDTGVPERHKKLCKYHRTLELYECQLAALPKEEK